MSTGEAGTVLLCLAGDVMTGRGIDQILTHPGDWQLYESYVRDARDYVLLAEEVSGAVPRAVGWDYVWGDALAELEARAPDASIVNLETAITRSDDYWPGKGVHYRMNPANLPCLERAGFDCCVLANNHVLDWGLPGLADTCAALESAGIRFAGAGANRRAAEAPAIIPLPGGGRLLVFGVGAASSGIPSGWAAGDEAPGVCFISRPSRAAGALLARINALRQVGDLVLVSLHWGGNWGYAVPDDHVAFAHALIDGGVDVVHGHSSHHPMGIEIYQNRPVLYGCGDLLNDYEGIGSHQAYRSELTLLYWLRLDAASGELLELAMSPLRVRRLQLVRADAEDSLWQARRLTRASAAFNVEAAVWDGQLVARWQR